MSRIRALVNGQVYEGAVDDHTLLLDFIRNELGLTGTKQSCEVQVCGACTVLVDGQPVSSCCFLAADIGGSSVETIEGVAETEFFQRVSAAFTERSAIQCGFCTPGLVLTLKWLDNRGGVADREDLAADLSGNLCRCTGYKSILDASERVLGLWS